MSEALSTMRLRFGEPVRFRFLAGVLSSAGGQVDLLLAGLRFLNAFLRSAPGPQHRVYIQVRLGVNLICVHAMVYSLCNIL